jgi:hypothetical protein
MEDFGLIQNVARSSTLDLEAIQRDVRHLRNQINRRNEFLSNTLASAVSGRERLEQLQRSREDIRLQHEQVRSTLNVVALSLILTCIYLIWQILNPRFPSNRLQHSHNENVSHPQYLGKLSILSRFSEMPGDVCAVCLDAIAIGDKVMTLDCRHEFHWACLEPWILKHDSACPTCPTCRSFVRPVDAIRPRKVEISQVARRTAILRASLSGLPRQAR